MECMYVKKEFMLEHLPFEHHEFIFEKDNKEIYRTTTYHANEANKLLEVLRNLKVEITHVSGTIERRNNNTH